MLHLIFLQAVEEAEKVAEYTKQTAENTDFLPWNAVALGVAFVTLFFAYCTWRSQRQTERNTNRLHVGVQKYLLVDLCRHLYRNLVLSYAIAKLIRPDFKRYPSEEHLMKMKVNPEDIHPELYYKRMYSFQQINLLPIMLRNYNTEIDIISGHLSNPTLDNDTKERDLKTLLAKCNILTRDILRFLAISRLEEEKPQKWEQTLQGIRFAKPEDMYGELSSLIADEISDVRNAIKAQNGWDARNFSNEKATEYKVIDPDYLGTTIYESIFSKEEFLFQFDADVQRELKENAQGGKKVWLIDFPANS